jgi:hypothetical protein
MGSPTHLLISEHLYRFVCERETPIRFGDLFHSVFNGGRRGAFEKTSCRGKRTRSPNLNMCYMDELSVRLESALAPLTLHITLPPESLRERTAGEGDDPADHYAYEGWKLNRQAHVSPKSTGSPRTNCLVVPLSVSPSSLPRSVLAQPSPVVQGLRHSAGRTTRARYSRGSAQKSFTGDSSARAQHRVSV